MNWQVEIAALTSKKEFGFFFWITVDSAYMHHFLKYYSRYFIMRQISVIDNFTVKQSCFFVVWLNGIRRFRNLNQTAQSFQTQPSLSIFKNQYISFNFPYVPGCIRATVQYRWIIRSSLKFCYQWSRILPPLWVIPPSMNP